ncbi:MAG: SRPBCC domain-containing protein [Candidatus Dojkabacteria bacterium]
MKLTIEDKIPKPISEVYDAIVNPDKLINYFVTKTSNQIIEGKSASWDFGEEGQVTIRVTQLEKDKLIEFNWPATGLTTNVEIKLEEIDVNTTKIVISEGEWKLDKDSVSIMVGQTQGWTGFINGLKSYLLFNINLREGKKL